MGDGAKPAGDGAGGELISGGSAAAGTGAGAEALGAGAGAEALGREPEPGRSGRGLSRGADTGAGVGGGVAGGGTPWERASGWPPGPELMRRRRASPWPRPRSGSAPLE